MRTAALLATALALTLVTGAQAVGPSLPDVAGGLSASEVSYVVTPHASTTLLSKRIEGHTVAQAMIQGAWGIPLVTLGATSGRGGLSPDGRTLVLGDNVHPDGALRSHSRFAVVDTARLALLATVSLRGDYSFDALAPHGRWLFLIHHVPSDDNRYQVKAYDLRSRALVPGVIADKRQAGWLMAGYPVARATSAGGRWVYTLYQQANNYPFVHALDTVSRTAVCVGLPWEWAAAGASGEIGTAKLSLAGGKLTVIAGHTGKPAFSLDTASFRVTKL
jgi:hypothetical protein